MIPSGIGLGADGALPPRPGDRQEGHLRHTTIRLDVLPLLHEAQIREAFRPGVGAATNFGSWRVVEESPRRLTKDAKPSLVTGSIVPWTS